MNGNGRGSVPLDHLLVEATAALAAAGVTSPLEDARALAAHARGIARPAGATVTDPGGHGAAVAAGPSDEGLDDERTADRFRGLIEQRRQRVPLPHLTGTVSFLGLELLARPGVFLPRQESDVLVEEALRACAAVDGAALVVDLCTGSGAIACALAVNAPRARIVAVDISAESVDLARANRRQFSPATDRIRIEQVDATDPSALHDLDSQVDVIVANPPYIPPDGVPREKEVRDHEPALALFGGGFDGLAIMRGMLPTAARLLRPGGLLILQHSDVQGGSVRGLVAAAVPGCFGPGTTHHDHQGSERYLTARRLGGAVGR